MVVTAKIDTTAIFALVERQGPEHPRAIDTRGRTTAAVHLPAANRVAARAVARSMLSGTESERSFPEMPTGSWEAIVAHATPAAIKRSRRRRARASRLSTVPTGQPS